MRAARHRLQQLHLRRHLGERRRRAAAAVGRAGARAKWAPLVRLALADVERQPLRLREQDLVLGRRRVRARRQHKVAARPRDERRAAAGERGAGGGEFGNCALVDERRLDERVVFLEDFFAAHDAQHDSVRRHGGEHALLLRPRELLGLRYGLVLGGLGGERALVLAGVAGGLEVHHRC